MEPSRSSTPHKQPIAVVSLGQSQMKHSHKIIIEFSRALTWLALFLTITLGREVVPFTCLQAQTVCEEWSKLMQRQEGWLGADGVYSIRLRFDSATGEIVPEEEDNILWLFSDTVYGKTRKNGAEYDSIQLVNHSFALLNDTVPDPRQMKFLWQKTNGDESENALIVSPPHNIVQGHYWLQDGVRFKDAVWLTAILVGDAWKPRRIDAVEIPLDPQTRLPDFTKVRVDQSANLSVKTPDKQLVLGAAICDDSNDGYIYIFGYVDHFRQGGRKDAVVARVPRSELLNYAVWQFHQGNGNWSNDINVLLEPNAALVSNVSTEFSVSKIPFGKRRDKWLLVYTPGVISERVAFRIGDSPVGPFGKEHVFYRSDIPRQMPGIRCYNAKAHPVFATEEAILVSYNVNRLGELPKRPEEYRPRFIKLLWKTVEEATESELKEKKDDQTSSSAL